jgi:hypothetical protein
MRAEKIMNGFSGLSGATSLKVGDKVVLLRYGEARVNDTTLYTKWKVGQTTAQAGLTLEYTFNIPKVDGDMKITARVIDIKVRSEAKALAEGYLSGMAFLGQGSDFLLSQGMSAVQDASDEAIDRPQGFAAVGYGNIHHQTGSSVAVEGHHLIAGITPWVSAFQRHA